MSTEPTPTPPHAGLPWVGLHVEPCAHALHDAEIIWLGVAGRGFDFERAGRLCTVRKVYQVLFEYDGTRVQADFNESESFADFITCCRDELAFNPPAFDSEAAEKVIRDTIRLLCAEEVRALVAALDLAESPPPPDLSAVPLDALLQELMRRDMAGDCVAMVITPSDLSEYWECDDAGSTHPGSAVPTLGEMRAIQKAFGRWQDHGGFTEVMEVCRDAWNDAKEDLTK